MFNKIENVIMDEKKRYEIDALLAFIQNKKHELLSNCRAYKLSVETVISHPSWTPPQSFGQWHGPTPNPLEVINFQDNLDLEKLDESIRYIAIPPEHWTRQLEQYTILEKYLTDVMEIHWLLLYYTHRFHLIDWAPHKAIPIQKAEAISIKDIDEHLVSYYYRWGMYGRDMIQDITTFAAKAIGSLAPVNIVDIYFDRDDPEERYKKLNSLLMSLPYADGIAFAEVLDCILFVYSQGGYKNAASLFDYYICGVPSYAFLDRKQEGIQEYINIIKAGTPTILPSSFNNAEELLSCIKEEYNANRYLIENEVCVIIDKFLGLSTSVEQSNISKPQPFSFSGGPKPGRPEEYWMTKRYASIPRIKDKFLAGFKKNIWTPLYKTLTQGKYIIYPSGLQSDKTYNALCASLIFHAAEKSKIAKVKYIDSQGNTADFINEPYQDVDDTFGGNDIEEVFIEAQELQYPRPVRRDKKSNKYPVVNNEGLSQYYGRKGRDMPIPQWALVFPSSYEECLSAIGIKIGHGTPRPYLRMLNYWLPEYVVAEDKKHSEKLADREYEDAGAEYIRDHECKKDIQSKQELLKKNIRQLQELLTSLIAQLPEYMNGLE